MDVTKPILVLSSHGHHDHYQPEIFSMLNAVGMQTIYAVLSDDIEVPANVNVLQVVPGKAHLPHRRPERLGVGRRKRFL